MSSVASVPSERRAATVASRLPQWWPLAALVVLAAALRLGTLGLQSFWYDEAFTPLHVLHPSLFSTLHGVTRTENSPPLWYIVEWLDYRAFGTGEYALRLPSALAGIALVPVAWAIGRELCDRAAAIACAALVTVCPLFVWYSQEARVYGLFTLTVGLAMLAFVRALREPSGRRMALFALAGAVSLLTHYFAVFILAGMGLWLLADRRTRRASLPALAALAVVALALLPLILAQGGRNTQWIGNWALKERIEQIPAYYLTGFSGGRLGHSIEALVGVPLFAASMLGLWRMRASIVAGEQDERLLRRRQAVWVTLTVSSAGVLIPLALALVGLDYMAPRNLVGAMVPVTALIAVLGTWPGRDPAGPLLLGIGAAALLAVTLTVDLDSKVQRGDWRGVVADLPSGRERAITVNQLGSAPVRYYTPGMRQLAKGESVRVREIVQAGEEPLRVSAGKPPAAGFHLAGTLDFHGLVVFRFVTDTPRLISETALRRKSITLEHGTVLVPGNARTTR